METGFVADSMANQNNTGLKRVIRATGYSLNGLKEALLHEAAFRQELALLMILTPIAIWLGHNGMERALLIGSLLLVLAVELLNSAVEAVVDRIGFEHHLLAKRAKDMGSAAVFICLANVILIWVLVLVPWW